MSELSNRNRILIIDSGGGYGGPGRFLPYFLKYLDQDKIQPRVAFLFYPGLPQTHALEETGRSILFLRGKRALARHLFRQTPAATNRHQLKIAPATERMVTIFEGVDLKKFDPSSAHPELRTELGIPADRKVVGYISRLVEGKGHNQFVEAAVSIVRNYKDVVFLIVGNEEAGIDGPSMKSLKGKVQDLGLPDYFIFVRCPTDIPQILSILDVFVHCPTTWIEGLGIAHLEAMAMAKPTVVSRNAGLPPAAVHAGSGVTH